MKHKSIADCGIHNNSTISLEEASGQNLYFKTPSNEKTIELEANSSDVFHRIKSIIEKKAGIHSYDHLFYCNGNLISADTRSLDSLSISGKEATLQMIFEPNDGLVSFSVETTAKTIIEVQISVRTRSGETITLEVTQVDTISDVKEKNFKETDVPVS
ncbi:hypothetical protein WN944_026069 [Citrus x changshan-huyou]|uniref:Ubiquitin-like domain-containing protein n=1 Tax=Citrus x changshan-huyou TaxID=2935761 RepID=A0AAP0LUF0_9ROSI